MLPNYVSNVRRQATWKIRGCVIEYQKGALAETRRVGLQNGFCESVKFYHFYLERST
jgi:hypothetical protein